jgi:hypothetical protein
MCLCFIQLDGGRLKHLGKASMEEGCSINNGIIPLDSTEFQLKGTDYCLVICMSLPVDLTDTE